MQKQINKAVEILTKGGVIIFPTETVYGIGCAYDDQKAIDRIYEIKKRPKDKPLQILVADKKQLDELVAEIPKEARELIDKNWPGPVTIIVAASRGGTIGIRMPDHPIVLQIIKELGKPLAATSANISGEPAPTSVDEIKIQADLIIDGGSCKFKKASQIIDFTKKPPQKIR
ncbi:MAG: threonylcarbamoyl-AMP synthase [Candidatus Saganbacteria bacterium]|nr:threonylcarbamoyl-AMP synthase [Candidatus Saganbacteria bacterium]